MSKKVEQVYLVAPYVYTLVYDDGTSKMVVVRNTCEEITNMYGKRDGKDVARFSWAVVLAIHRNISVGSAFNLIIATEENRK